MDGILNKKTVGGFFLALLILLIFFSRTIYSGNLISVTAVKPHNGRLSKLEITSGIADWSEIEKLYSAVGGTVEEMLVKEGDYVNEGQELLRLSFDRDEAERKLKEIQNSKNKLYTDIQGINLRIEKLERYAADLKNEEYEAETVSEYELDALYVDISRARAELQDVRERHEEGDATDLELDKARYAMEALYLKLEELKRKLEEQEKNAAKSLEDKEKSRETKLLDYQQEIAGLKLDLQNKHVDMNNLALQEEPYQKALEDFETYAALTAPAEGTLISLNTEKGEKIQPNQLIASVGVGGEFVLECVISLDNNFVVSGDSCELSNTVHELTGTVSKITPGAQGKTVRILLSSDEVTAGETFEVTFEKESQTSYTLVPNGAVNQDNDGYFLNQVKRRDGILGEEYYLERLDVYIGDSDSQNTVIIKGITFFEPVALISDSPVQAGDVIALKNAGDFFEK